MKITDNKLKESYKARYDDLNRMLKMDIKYPMSFVTIGFPKLDIESKEELKGRIKELKDLLWL